MRNAIQYMIKKRLNKMGLISKIIIVLILLALFLAFIKDPGRFISVFKPIFIFLQNVGLWIVDFIADMPTSDWWQHIKNG